MTPDDQLRSLVDTALVGIHTALHKSTEPPGVPTPQQSEAHHLIDEKTEAAARVQNKSVDALTIEIDRVRKDPDFVARVKRLVERDREILDRLADC